MLTQQQPAPPTRYRWTRQQYEQMIEAGVFDEDARVELIHGEVVTMRPQSSRHATIVTLVAKALRSAIGEGWYVREQLPLALDPDSEPEPDLAVVAGAPLDYFHAHPTAALLVVEVADSSRRKDRTEKVALYGRHGIREYWLFDLVEYKLIVHRQPEQDGYAERLMLTPADSVTAPETSAPIPVRDMLP
jgi:Uma2 family endonuclease